MEIKTISKKNIISYKNESKTVEEWSSCCGIHIDTLRRRLFYNWSIEDALFTPVRKCIKSEPEPELERLSILEKEKGEKNEK